MKLLVIALCLLSERFLIHSLSQQRTYWFASYFKRMQASLAFSHQNQYIMLALAIIPLVLIALLLLVLAQHVLFGVITFFLNLGIFYFCLGPENPFFPNRSSFREENSQVEVENYFVRANDHLFAVIFWYIVLGPLAILIYRLFVLSQGQELTARAATVAINILNWLPARVTLLLYLLVGNFQQGFPFLVENFTSAPANNAFLLGKGGLLALQKNEQASVLLIQAETLVEHAIVTYLVFLAFFTLVAWI